MEGSKIGVHRHKPVSDTTITSVRTTYYVAGKQGAGEPAGSNTQLQSLFPSRYRSQEPPGPHLLLAGPLNPTNLSTHTCPPRASLVIVTLHLFSYLHISLGETSETTAPKHDTKTTLLCPLCVTLCGYEPSNLRFDALARKGGLASCFSACACGADSAVVVWNCKLNQLWQRIISMEYIDELNQCNPRNYASRGLHFGGLVSTKSTGRRSLPLWHHAYPDRDHEECQAIDCRTQGR